jgi:predicted ArsR family transcriptional regulator
MAYLDMTKVSKVAKEPKDASDKKLYDERLYVAMQPARKRILSSLDQSQSYASKLADELSINPKVVQFHLDILLKYGLVTGQFDLESPSDGRPVAVRRFKLTEAGQDMIAAVNSIPQPP